MHLGELDTALEIAQTSGSEAKWRQLGELSLAVGKLEVCSHITHPRFSLHEVQCSWRKPRMCCGRQLYAIKVV